MAKIQVLQKESKMKEQRAYKKAREEAFALKLESIREESESEIEEGPRHQSFKNDKTEGR